VIQTSARWLELLTAVGCMLKQVQAMRSERDHRHATGKRRTVAAIRRAHHCCPKHVAVETKASVKVGNRDAEMTYTNQMRTTNIAWHGDNDATSSATANRFRSCVRRAIFRIPCCRGSDQYCPLLPLLVSPHRAPPLCPLSHIASRTSARSQARPAASPASLPEYAAPQRNL
jgi:hypothetical protein